MSSVVALDPVGRLPLPEGLRMRHHLRSGSLLRIDEEEGRIILEPVEERPRLLEHGGLLLVDAPLDGPAPDHRQLREEHLARLTEDVPE